MRRARGVSGQGKTKGLTGTKYTGKLPVLPLLRNQLVAQLPLARIQSGTYPTVFIRGVSYPWSEYRVERSPMYSRKLTRTLCLYEYR